MTLLIWPDILHQCAKGNMEHVVKLLKAALSAEHVACVNEQLRRCPVYPGLCLPSCGLSTPRMFAAQQAAMFKCLAVALLAVDTPFAETARRVIIGEDLHPVEMHACIQTA